MIEILAWPQEPAFTNSVDGATNYTMGIRFSISKAGSCVGVEWRVPDTVETPAGGTHTISIWDVASGNRIAAFDFTPVTGALQDIFFAVPVALVAGPFYVAAVHTNHYVYRAGSFPVSSPNGFIVADQGRLIVSTSGNPGTFPSETPDAFYYVSPIMEFTDGEPETTPVTTTVTGKWRVYGRVTSTVTGKWRVYQRITSSLTSKWRVFQKVATTLRSKWLVIAGAAPAPVVNAGYLNAQRMMTQAYVNDDPTTLQLVPVTRVATPSGGFAEVDGVPRMAQTVKMILLAYDQRPTLTVAGVERVIDYHLFGRWDMDIQIGDYWVDGEGTRWDIVGFSEGWDYMTKAFASRHVPRDARP